MVYSILAAMKKPYGPVLAPAALAVMLLVTLWLLRSFGIESIQRELAAIEADWVQARRELQFHREAQRARQELDQVWAALPHERDFAPLALGITDEAKRHQVILPALSYKTEATPVPTMTRGLLQGIMTGRYEDLRRFLHEIETADELVYIEDLDLVRSGAQQDQSLTFNIKIGTYLKKNGGAPAAP
jgi:Tfp pilus assembly protein PilO